MMFLLSCAIKVSAILAVALLLMVLLRRQSAAIRHWILSSAILCAAITPVATLALPSWNVNPSNPPMIGAPPISAAIGEPAKTDAVATPAKPALLLRIPGQVFQSIWLAGLCLGLLSLLTGCLRLARLASCSDCVRHGKWAELAEAIASQSGLRRRVRLLQSLNPAILVTWGVLRPKVLLPARGEEWPEDRIHAVLCHELAHVRRGDWAVQTTAELLRAFYWFNPLIWILCKRLRLESEYACDDAVLAQGVSGTKYAAHLLDVVRLLHQPDRAWSAALAMARPSTVERRFTAMLNPDLNRRKVTPGAMFAIVVGALCITLPLAALSSSATAQVPTVKPVAPAMVLVTPLQSPGPNQAPAQVAPSQPVTAYRQLLKESLEVVRPVSAPPPPPPPPPQQQSPFTGEIITLDLKNADFRDFFRFIGDISGRNIVLDPNVTGTVTILARNLPWDQVLDIVLRNNQLSGQLQGNVLRIMQNPRDRIGLQFDVYRNGTLITSPRISTPDGTRAELKQNDVAIAVTPTIATNGAVSVDAELTQNDVTIAVTPTRATNGAVSVDLEFSLGKASMRTNLVVSAQEPGTISSKSAVGTDSFEVRITLVPTPSR